MELKSGNDVWSVRRVRYEAAHSYIACIYVNPAAGKSYRINYAITNLIGDLIEKNFVEVGRIDYEAIDDLLQNLMCSYGNIKVSGIGIPGIVHKNVIVASEIEELVYVPLAARLSAKYDLDLCFVASVNMIQTLLQGLSPSFDSG